MQDRSSKLNNAANGTGGQRPKGTVNETFPPSLETQYVKIFRISDTRYCTNGGVHPRSVPTACYDSNGSQNISSVRQTLLTFIYDSVDNKSLTFSDPKSQ